MSTKGTEEYKKNSTGSLKTLIYRKPPISLKSRLDNDPLHMTTFEFPESVNVLLYMATEL